MIKLKPRTKAGQIERPKIVRANANCRHERREPFVSLYANDASVQVTPWDIRVIFGVFNGDADAIVVTELSEIRMSPQFATRLAMVLVKQLKRYEQTVGPIPLPAEPR